MKKLFVNPVVKARREADAQAQRAVSSDDPRFTIQLIMRDFENKPCVVTVSRRDAQVIMGRAAHANEGDSLMGKTIVQGPKVGRRSMRVVKGDGPGLIFEDGVAVLGANVNALAHA